jgi:Glyoxalase superfamily protein
LPQRTSQQCKHLTMSRSPTQRRDFRDAKAMAQSLREALKAKSIALTHSESLELIAKTFGFHDWNVLSAAIQASRPANPANRRLKRAPAALCCPWPRSGTWCFFRN